ncbi:MAG: hypothetical protein QOE87_1797 [Gaiellales bacterium]|nr:hypothetical protein [Gaiellales bacterium]
MLVSDAGRAASLRGARPSCAAAAPSSSARWRSLPAHHSWLAPTHGRASSNHRDVRAAIAFGGGEVELFTYGPDADVVFGVIEDSLRGFEVRPGSYAIKRYGAAEDPNVREERVELA